MREGQFDGFRSDSRHLRATKCPEPPVAVHRFTVRDSQDTFGEFEQTI